MEEEGQEGGSSARSDEPEARSEVRWSARRKEGVVLRLLRGESLDLLARETGQPAGRISAWREEFLDAGREGLKSRPAAVEDVALGDAQQRVEDVDLHRQLTHLACDALRRYAHRHEQLYPDPSTEGFFVSLRGFGSSALSARWVNPWAKRS
jgi:hypothetical protein